MKKRIGVNIDHVATVRNARGESYPSPLKAALLAQKSKADSITIHLREDRRHINDSDLSNIKKKIKIPINLEIAATKEMLKIALKHKPDYVCIVPEKRKELTTEGGLNLKYKQQYLKFMIKKLKKKGIRVSLFIEPRISSIKLSKILGVDCIEIHTGKFCSLFNKKKFFDSALNNIRSAAIYGKKIGLEIHAGHGLTYNSAKKLIGVKEIVEFNIGHYIISESIFFGLKKAIGNFKKILQNK